MPLTAAQVQGYLNENGVSSVTLLANSSPASQAAYILLVNIEITVPNGKSLTLFDGIDVTV